MRTFDNASEVRLKDDTAHKIPRGYFLTLGDHLVCHSSHAGRAHGRREQENVPIPKAPFEPIPRSLVAKIVHIRPNGAVHELWAART